MGNTPKNHKTQITDHDYQQILKFRTQLRHFMHWSEQQIGTVGLTPSQYQLLLAIRGHASEDPPTVTDIANYLFLHHHSVVGLIDRAEKGGWVKRIKDSEDHRLVRVVLEKKGRESLEKLVLLHVTELESLAATFPQFDIRSIPK